MGSAAAFVAEREVKDCLQLATGLGMDGSITRAAHGRRFVKVASKPLQKASDIFTVEMKLQPKPYSLMVLSFGDGSSDMESASRVLLVHESPRDYESDADLASVKAVMDLCMAEVNTSDDGDGFILDEITIGLLELAPNVVMQAVKGGLRIVRLDRDKDTGAGKGKVHGKAKGRVDLVWGPIVMKALVMERMCARSLMQPPYLLTSTLYRKLNLMCWKMAVWVARRRVPSCSRWHCMSRNECTVSAQEWRVLFISLTSGGSFLYSLTV